MTPMGSNAGGERGWISLTDVVTHMLNLPAAMRDPPWGGGRPSFPVPPTLWEWRLQLCTYTARGGTWRAAVSCVSPISASLLSRADSDTSCPTAPHPIPHPVVLLAPVPPGFLCTHGTYRHARGAGPMPLPCSPHPSRPGPCPQLTRKPEHNSWKWNQIFLLWCGSLPQKGKKNKNLTLKVNFPNLISQAEQLKMLASSLVHH